MESSNPIAAEGMRIEEDALYSAKGHFEAAHLWGNCHFCLGLISTIVAAAAGATAIKAMPAVAATLATLAAILTGLLTFLNPRERAAAHLKAGNLYKSLNNDSRIFRTVACVSAVASLTKDLALLNDRRNKLNGESPQIPRLAFVLARRAIESGEATYVADAKVPTR